MLGCIAWLGCSSDDDAAVDTDTSGEATQGDTEGQPAAQWAELPAHAVSVLGPIWDSRNVVFFDKRGNGLSIPALSCPDYDEEFFGLFTVDADAATDAEAFVRDLGDSGHSYPVW